MPAPTGSSAPAPPTRPTRSAACCCRPRRWDSGWFLSIAQGGYDVPEPRTAFFPLYPLLIRIVGEPIWAGRTDKEYPACAEHEALINVALGSSPAYIQCPYDTAKLPSSVLTDATRTHPMLATAFERWTSPTYTDPGAVADAVRSILGPSLRAAVARTIGRPGAAGEERRLDLASPPRRPAPAGLKQS